MKFGGIEFVVEQRIYKEEQCSLEHYLAALRGTLDKTQRQLLLRILDTKDLVCEKTAEDQFSKGFFTAVTLMQACFTPIDRTRPF